MAIKTSTAKKCSRIKMYKKAGEEGSVNDTSHPMGDSQENGDCRILNRVPSAAKPVARIHRKIKRGILGFWVALPDAILASTLPFNVPYEPGSRSLAKLLQAESDGGDHRGLQAGDCAWSGS